MIKTTLIVAAILLTCHTQTYADTVWFVVAATSKTLTPIIEVKKNLAAQWPESFITTTDDCYHDRAGLYLLAVKRSGSKAAAMFILKKLREQIADAYYFVCHIKPQSRLSLGIPLIDPSIEKVPEDAVNWSDRDRVTELRHLINDEFIVLKKLYDSDDQSFREGRRVDVFFVTSKAKNASLLTENCWDFGGVSYTGNTLAFHCASMVAADHLIHNVMVFHLKSLQKVFEKDYCRNPVLLGDRRIKCEEETVDVNGKLILKHIEDIAIQ